MGLRPGQAFEKDKKVDAEIYARISQETFDQVRCRTFAAGAPL